MPPSQGIVESMQGLKPIVPSASVVNTGGGQVSGTSWTPKTLSDSAASEVYAIMQASAGRLARVQI